MEECIGPISADHFDDGRAEAGAVDDQLLMAAESRIAGEGSDGEGDFGKGSAERKAFEVADGDDFLFGPCVGDRAAGTGEDVGSFDDADGGVVAGLAEVDADVVVGIGRRRGSATDAALGGELILDMGVDGGQDEGGAQVIAVEVEWGKIGERFFEEGGWEDSVFGVEKLAAIFLAKHMGG